MTPETAALLARALLIRDSAAEALGELSRLDHAEDAEGVKLAEVYVHEQRIINRIVSESRD